jgi:hypothetical protein
MPPWLLVLALWLFQPPSLLTLEIRVFHGLEEVTAETRVTVHRAGERGQPVAQIGRGDAGRTMKVAPGLYDCQAVRERDGRVLNIRWAERLVVMPYPDEAGYHLEVINLMTGFGALQVPTTTAGGTHVEVALFGAGQRGRPTASASGPGYTLFAVPAGQYDLEIKRGPRITWQNGVEVPLDRTRLWVVP